MCRNFFTWPRLDVSTGESLVPIVILRSMNPRSSRAQSVHYRVHAERSSTLETPMRFIVSADPRMKRINASEQSSLRFSLGFQRTKQTGTDYNGKGTVSLNIHRFSLGRIKGLSIMHRSNRVCIESRGWNKSKHILGLLLLDIPRACIGIHSFCH